MPARQTPPAQQHQVPSQQHQAPPQQPAIVQGRQPGLFSQSKVFYLCRMQSLAN